MPAHAKTFFEKLAYIFAPADSKGIGFVDRLLLGMQGADNAWAARPDVPEEKRLLDMLAGLSMKFGISPPPLIIYESGVPNAASVISGSVMVGTRLMEIMTPGQMAAVLGHELTHHIHIARDMPVTLGLPIAYGVARAKLGMKPWQSTSGREKIAYTVLDTAGLGAVVLIPRAWQRSCEFEADVESAKKTSPGQMIGALNALEDDITRTGREQNEAREKMGLPPVAYRAPNPWTSTHPPMPDRIKALQALQEKEHARARGEQVFSADVLR